MPQLDFSTYLPQLFWLFIGFGIMYFLMAKAALPRIAVVLEQRRERIERDLDLAERLKKDTEDSIKAYETALNEARNKAHEIINKNREELNKHLVEEQTAIDERLASKEKKAQKEISNAKKKVLSQSGVIAEVIAEEAIKNLIGGKAPKAKIGKKIAAHIEN